MSQVTNVRIIPTIHSFHCPDHHNLSDIILSDTRLLRTGDHKCPEHHKIPSRRTLPHETTRRLRNPGTEEATAVEKYADFQYTWINRDSIQRWKPSCATFGADGMLSS